MCAWMCFVFFDGVWVFISVRVNHSDKVSNGIFVESLFCSSIPLILLIILIPQRQIWNVWAYAMWPSWIKNVTWSVKSRYYSPQHQLIPQVVPTCLMLNHCMIPQAHDFDSTYTVMDRYIVKSGRVWHQNGCVLRFEGIELPTPRDDPSSNFTEEPYG